MASLQPTWDEDVRDEDEIMLEAGDGDGPTTVEDGAGDGA